MEIGKICLNLLTENECVEVIRNAVHCIKSEIRITNFKLVPVSNPEIVGMLGEYFHLIIYAKIGTSQHSEKFEYFVKSIPVSDALQTKQIEKSKLFPKEIGLYTTLFKELEKYKITRWHPTCYYVRSDILVMEDLFNINYKHLNQNSFVPLDHMKSVLKCLSAMHSNSIIFEVQTGINIGKKYSEILQEVQIRSDCDWFLVGMRTIQAVAKSMPQFQKDKNIKTFLSEEFMKSMDKMIEIVKSSNTFRNVLCHRDLWMKNFFFKYENNKHSQPIHCLFVDFQLAGYHPPALDVLIFIYLNTNRKMRETYIKELLEFYYNSLKSDLKSANIDVEEQISWDEFMRSCEAVKPVPVILTGIFAQLAKLPAGFLEDLKKSNSEKYNHCIYVDRNDMVFERMEEEESFKENMFECVEEIVEFLMK